MTSTHRLCAVFLVCMTAISAAALISRHDGCIAFCTNIAKSGTAD
jgi:hypothetical protein